MSDPTPPGTPFDKWGLPLTLLVGAAALFAGLGNTGLWDPWEMDRADVARTLSEPAQVMVALRDRSGPVRDAVEQAAAAADVVARFAEAPVAGKLATTAATRTLRQSLDRAKTEITAAVVFDSRLLGSSGGPAAWNKAWTQLQEASRYVPNGRIIVIEAPGGPSQQDLIAELGAARVRTGYDELSEIADGLSKVTWPPVSDTAFWQPHLGGMPLLDDLVIVAPGPELADVLDDARAAAGRVVAFKDHGDTLTMPPLAAWLTAISYRLFGVSELTTRLGGALLGFLTLLALVMGIRPVYGTRTACLAGLVLTSTPLFFVQARSAAGEPGTMLGLALVLVALLGRGTPDGPTADAGDGAAVVHDPTPRWGLLLVGALVALLAKGLAGLAIVTVTAVAVAAVVWDAGRRLRLPAVALLALLGLVAVWVLGSPPDGWAGQLRFTVPMFSDGPTAYERNFDYALKAIGFGTFPWTPLMVVGLAALGLDAARDRDPRGVVVVVAFAVGSLATMGLLKAHNHFLWCAAPAGAVAVALFLERALKRGVASTFLGFMVLIMGFILARELTKDPQPLAGFLVVDPPFADQAGQRFPEEVTMGSIAMLAFAMAALVPAHHLTRFASATEPLRRFFRKPAPFTVALSAVVGLFGFVVFLRTAIRLVGGTQLDEARKAFGAAQLEWPTSFLAFGDPVSILGWVTLGGLVLIGLGRYGLLRKRYTARVVEAPLSGSKLTIGGVAWVVAGVHMLLSVTWPDGYWAETLGNVELLLVAALAAFLAWRATSSGAGAVAAGAVAAGILGLWLASRISRDATLLTPWLVGLVLIGWAGFAAALWSRLTANGTDFARLSGWLVTASFLLMALPLLERWDHIVDVVYPGTAESETMYLLTRSRVTWLLYLSAGFLVGNRYLVGRLGPLPRLLPLSERPWLAATAAVFGGLVFMVATLAGFYPSLAHHVSQKHIVDAYRSAEGQEEGALGERIFKHGKFAASGRKDANFYTAGIPEIRDRSAALQVLVGTRDQAVSLDTPSGTDLQLMRGYSPDNDLDGDGRRDAEAVAGFSTLVAADKLVDSGASWSPDEHAGRELIDSAGRKWSIEGNDATTLRLKGSGRPTFSPTRAERNVYVIDDPAIAKHRASALERERRYLLLPVDSFSDINNAYRKLTGGSHVPILDGRSSRVLLATTWLGDGEEQDNRYARHTLTRARFDALPAEQLTRGWATFDDKIRILGSATDKETYAPGDKVTLKLYFEVLSKVRTSQKIFMHIDKDGTTHRIHGDHWPLNMGVGEEPEKTCVGCYRTDHWYPGDVVIDVWEGEIPQGTPSGVQDIWLGLYNPTTDKRMVVKGWDKDRVRHDGNNRVRVGGFQVR